MEEDDDLLFYEDRGGERVGEPGDRNVVSKEEERLAAALFGGLETGGDEEDDLLAVGAGTKRARPGQEKEAAWNDDEDEDEDEEDGEENGLEVLVAANGPRGPVRQKVSAAVFEQQLRADYEEKRGPTPAWAQRTADEEKSLFGTTANVTREASGRVSVLEEGILKVQKLNNLNQEARGSDELNSVCFSPSSQVALTAARDKVLRLFQVNEKKCVKLHSVGFDDLPIKKAFFVPKSNEVLCMGFKKPFYLYDMERDAVVRVPHLMGQFETSWADVVPSPDGIYSAFLGGESGNVVLFSNRSRQIAHTLKMSAPVTRACFSAESSSTPFLWTAGPEGEVFKWDMRTTRRCVAKFRDQGAIGTESIANSPDGRWQAVGDKSGVVNIYSLSDGDEAAKTPFKSVGNLVTATSTLVWNHDSQMLAMASSKQMGALRVVHVPSFKVFSNWPMDATQVHTVTAIDVSPNSGYMAVGNKKGEAQLYRMLAYPRF